MNYNYPNNQPWDNRVYETGRTRPPKKRGGAIAVLLILVIFLSGLTCVLGFLNFQLFRQLSSQEKEDSDTRISFSNMEEFPTNPLDIASMDSQGETLPRKDGDKDTLHLTQIPTEASGESVSGSLTWQEVYKKNIPSVVSITCTHLGDTSTGTGVIFTADGYIVTNSHVVEGAREISVLLTDDRVFTARLVGADTVSDLAVLHIEAENLTPAEFGDSAGIQVGDAVVAIGDPLGTDLRGTMTEGIISAINRDMSIDGRTMTLIQTSAALNPGNSGGPLINTYGMVIGINTMKISAFTDKAGVEGLGFAIPSTTVKDIVEQIIENGYVSGRPTLGIHCEVLSSMYRHYYRLPNGLYINGVDRGSPAAEAGIAQGDVIVTINGTSVTDMESYNAFLYSQQVGDTVVLEIYRGGKYYTLRLTFAENQG